MGKEILTFGGDIETDKNKFAPIKVLFFKGSKY